MRIHDLSLCAGFALFYLQDDFTERRSLPFEAWSPQEVSDPFVAVAPGLVAVSTDLEVVVPVRVDILLNEPPADKVNFYHIVDCSLSITSGQMVVAGDLDEFLTAKRIPLPNGSYRVRVNVADLDPSSLDEEDSQDCYHVQLWRAPRIEPTLIKHFMSGPHRADNPLLGFPHDPTCYAS